MKKYKIKTKIIVLSIICCIIISGYSLGVIVCNYKGKQEGDIIINGGIGNTNTLLFDNKPLSSLEIDLGITEMNAGDYIQQWHFILDNDTENDYSFKIEIDDHWFDNVSSPEYGFTYGIKNCNNNDITGIDIDMETGENYSLYFWYSVDEMMITPQSGIVHPIIWINGTRD